MAECKEVVRQLKRQQHTTWRIELYSLSRDSLLTVLSNLNECPVRVLYVRNTRFNHARCVNELVKVMTYNKTMKCLRLYSSPLLPDTYHLLTAALSSNKTLNSLHLWYDKNITDNDIPHICDLITTNTTLEYLYLYDCPNITESGIQKIQKELVHNKSLVRFFINGSTLRS